MAENAPHHDQRFSQLVEGLVTKAQAETKSENADMLHDVIRSHINTWLKEVGNVNPLYKVSELIPVGSYAEGTKIIQPDEFDYLAVIEELSKPDMIRIDANESDIQHGFVKLVVKDKDLKSKCTGLCEDGHLKCFQPINIPGLDEERFGHVLIETLLKMVRSSKKLRGMSYGSPTDINCKILLTSVNNESLYFKGALFKAPNVIIRFEYKNIEVSVDVSPAIRYHNIHDSFIVKDCTGQAFADLVLSRKSILFVGTSSESDFKVTVTEAEVEYIQKVMKPEHKIIYIFLKYIVRLFNEISALSFPFTSYMIKTICIHHDVKCEKNQRSIKECFISVIEDLNICKQQQFVVSIVNKNIHLGPDFIEKWDRECLLPGFKKICQLPMDITTVEELDSFLLKIVQDQHQKRSNEDEEQLKKQRRVAESFRAELDEEVSKVVDMGFDPKEVRKVMGIYGYDADIAVIVLQEKAKKREEEKLKQSGNSLKSHEVSVQDSKAQSL